MGIILVVGIFLHPDTFVICFILILWMIVCLSFPLNLFPTIGTAQNGLRIYRPWRTYKTIPWKNITAVRIPSLPFFPFFGNRLSKKRGLLIKGKNIGVLNLFYGFMYDKGGEIILIHPQIERRSELLNNLKMYCPNALSNPNVGNQKTQRTTQGESAG
jgi:hypothetical protein